MSQNHTKHRNRTRGFTMIPNEISYDKNLSLKAFGMLMKLLMLAEDPDWNFSKKGLVKVTGWGSTIVDTALKELEELGYLVMTQPRCSKGKFAKPHWHIFEAPVSYDHESGEVTPYDVHGNKYSNLEVNMAAPGLRRGVENPVPENPIPGAPVPGVQTQYNNITIEESNIKDFNNSLCFAPGDFATQNLLDNETRGQGEVNAELCPKVSTTPLVPAQSTTALDEPDRVIKQLKKKYKSAFVNYALELSKDKDDSIAYAKTLLRDWKKQDLQTIDEVKRHVATFEDDKAPDLTVRSYVSGKARRVEMKPSWLDQEPQPYTQEREYTQEDLDAIERMKQIHQSFITNISDMESQLPF